MDASTIPEPPPAPSDPQGFSKSSRTWTTPVDLESSSRSNGRSSIDSTSDRPKSSQAGEGADSAKAGPSGLAKLLPARRRRKKKSQTQMDEFILSAASSDNGKEKDNGGRPNESRDGNSVTSSTMNENPQESEGVNLLTDDSEPDRTPPLTSHNSHAGFYTTSSPLIKTTSVQANDNDDVQADVESAPSLEASGSNPDTELSRSTTQPVSTLDVPEDRNGKKRGVSPGRRLKNAFSSNSDKKNSNSSRDRASSTSTESKKSVSLFGNSGRRGSLSAKRAQTAVAAEPPPPLPLAIRTDLTEDKPREPSENQAPKTPPHTAIPAPAPQTTLTPPTPSENRVPFPKLVTSPEAIKSPESVKSNESFPPGVVVSPSGNMISHRRVRSASSVQSHRPSKLSNSISAISPPTIEEVKNASRSPSAAQQSGFFSSVFSVAQNAANTLSSSLNTQPKGRSATQPTSAGSENVPVEGQEQTAAADEGEEKKPLAVETLGSGDLNFDHLEIDVPPGGAVATPDGVVITKPDVPPEKRKNTAVNQRDEEAARLEDKRAARAVYMAYGKPSEVSVIPPSEDGIELQSSTSLPKELPSDQTPPGSVLDGEPGSGLKRSGSVRSRLARRHRGSSATTSTIGAIGAGAIALGVPGANSSMPRLTGFAVASKKRNRDFHQLFRSVPEDDYLIEDYSCALQREIILAGRIYISEGHICFSSNILGWVTTLVISFDEVVAIEKESTAMVFPNAIAIQTLHARHTFRSLLSRESTYDLMVNIWKINHPALKSSVNGTRIAHGTGDKTEKAGESDVESDDSDEDEVYDEDEDGDGADSFIEAGDASVNGSDKSMPMKGPSRKASGLLPTANGAGGAAGSSNGDAKGDKSGGDADTDFPGPTTHAPTEYTDPAGQYDKVIKDEIIPAPLGKVYSLVFGPASGAFISKFLVENQKSGELQFESEKKGLTNESRTRQYSYIKPLNAPIGPKQTKCITTEYMDFLDLEKAVLVTLSTQTPDVPSGNVFCTKTKYLFTWAPGNQTRFFLTCTIEWSGKSWLKGPIEKGAVDGQGAFGTDLIQALKAAVVPRSRSGTKTGGGKGKGKRKKGGSATEEPSPASMKATSDASAGQADSWGVLEPLHGLLGPIVDIVKPLLSGNIVILLVGILLFMLFFRSPAQPAMLSHDIGCPGYSLPQRLAAYEEMWRREESELWSWLEDRVGMDGMVFPTANRPLNSQIRQKPRKIQGEREMAEKLSEEKMSDREMDHAIRTTRERLGVLEEMLTKRKAQWTVDEEVVVHQEL
ncbi:hypothetical protein ASPWEDRAFT_101336 [Aspergillus wentii DTO 134E9]|uniref:VASt domain-containing protein n=1 Tax=Aspergillus wentii DTO 134E9 TaxID=1073089 RepID=A0A1L9S2S7_ASPWE|nr:uncharacterized protein ASPWEDRAFT_101336 [Aspergillus wentii DTO 134E9]KAI9929808.1 hypothetical protein MW887_011613 [Aspergillus wentii]OJJ41463.1 hypothetical protein ASPWEDRAFT_101336 [Aspergillus wentii DTO 134E9]